MFEAFNYLYDTIKQQIVDQITIFQEITEFYVDQIKRNMVFKKKINQIKNKLNKAHNYDQWKYIANQYDSLQEVQQSLNQVYSPYYDYEYIAGLKNQLNKARKKEDISKLITILRSHSYRNIGNINCDLLYRDAYNSTKNLIEEFQHQIIQSLRNIMHSDLSTYKKLQFFGEMRHSVGRSALLLSGGALLGMYHIGVVQTLVQANCMPKIIAGSSAGSMIAAFVATRPIQDFFDGQKMNFTAFINKKKNSIWKKFKRVAKEGYVLDINVIKNFMRDNLGDITFQEAFDKYGYILNITVTGTNQHDEDRLLNYLTAPNVMIWSAVSASCAIPFVYGATDLFCKDIDGQIKPYTLLNRKFLDGSIAHDLPMNKLSIFFNVNNFIVSQTNPWVIPFMDYTQEFKTSSNPLIVKLMIIFHRLKQFTISELKHRAGQMAFLFPGAVTKFFNLATQSYVGNITIWPVPSVKNYLRIMQNPTSYSNILNFVEDGKMRTYPKICQIKSSQFYQKQINNCLKQLKMKSFFVDNKHQHIENSEQQDSYVKMTDRLQLQDIFEDDRYLGSKNMKYRNQSFMIPRQNSYKL